VAPHPRSAAVSLVVASSLGEPSTHAARRPGRRERLLPGQPRPRRHSRSIAAESAAPPVGDAADYRRTP